MMEELAAFCDFASFYFSLANNWSHRFNFNLHLVVSFLQHFFHDFVMYVL